MALTPSCMMPLGTPAPAFVLPEPLTGAIRRWDEVRGEKATVVMFICNHCPYVQHINAELVRVARTYSGLGVGFVAISSNDAVMYPADAPAQMAACAEKLGDPFPYLYDETQSVARAFDAACTPDFFVFDADDGCAYRGRFDGATPGNGVPVTGDALCAALDALVAGRAPHPHQQPSLGCNIKWRP